VYYVSFVNYLSRNTRIYFLKKKYEFLDIFKEFNALVANQTEKKMKVLMMNNGGELSKTKFQDLFKKCGIT